MDYRKEIDGLRAVAVIPVILFHAGFTQFGGGFVGVDVFFVISGYLITSILIAELDAGKFSIVKFYERRARRILPALFAVLALCLPFAWLWLLPGDMKGFAQSLVAVMVFGSNVLFWQQSGYFDTAAELKPLLHTWSLAVEEQFYVLFPLFLMFFWRRDRRWLLGVLAAMTLASLAIAQWGSSNSPTAAFFLLPARGWELAIGAFCAYYLAHRDSNKAVAPAVGQALALCGLLLIAASIFLFSKDTPFPGIYALVPTLGTALIILFATPATATGAILGSKTLVGIGLISYSAYLWHQPLIAFARHRSFEEPHFLLMPALVILTLVLAYLSWRFVEQPFRQKGRIGRQQVFGIAIAGSLVFLSLGLVGHKTDGLKEVRTNSKQLEVLATAVSSPKRQDCHTGSKDYRKPQDACSYFGPAGQWAVFGDSHAVELAYAVAEVLKPDGVGVRHYSFSGCSPSYKRSTKLAGCGEWTDETVEYIAANADITNVVVTYRIHSALFGDHAGFYPRLPDQYSVAQREATWASYKAILQRFVDAGKHVVLVMQAPEIPRQVESLILHEADPQLVAGASLQWWQQRSKYVYERMAELPAAVRIVKPESRFCDTQRCYAVRDGKALYFDDDHMSLQGAGFVARDVVAALRPAAPHANQPLVTALGRAQ